MWQESELEEGGDEIIIIINDVMIDDGVNE